MTPVSRVTRNVRLLQWVDRRLGAVVCFVLTWCRRLLSWTRGSERAHQCRRIVFIKLAEQGSTVLAHEAIRRAVARVGRERVYFLVFEENRFILDALGLLPAENVLTVRTSSAARMIASALGRLVEIRRLHIDACVDLEFFSRSSAAIAFLTGCAIRVGFHSYFGEGPYRGDLLTHRVLYNPHLHTSRLFTTLVMAIDTDPAALPTLDFVAPPSPPLPMFSAPDGELAEVRQLLGELGYAPGASLVLLNPNASDQLPLRRWDPANYVALATRLLAIRPDLWIAFTGGIDEALRVEALARQVGSPRALCLAGRTTLRQLLLLYRIADVLVTNDSGPAHFAALTTIDTVVLFGPETPVLFAALGPRTHPLWAGISCSPCVNAYNNRQTACRDNRCMQRIEVEDVFAATIRALEERRRTPRLATSATGTATGGGS